MLEIRIHPNIGRLKGRILSFSISASQPWSFNILDKKKPSEYFPLICVTSNFKVILNNFLR